MRGKIKNVANNGFTLVELLIVIAIIGILASVILVSLNNSREKTRYAKAKSEMAQFIKIAEAARLNVGRTLFQITANGCSGCACRADLGGGATDPNCISRWDSALSLIGAAASVDVSGLADDPWGNPYVLDENEGVSGSCANKDSIRCMGPNGIHGDSDDILMRINFLACPG